MANDRQNGSRPKRKRNEHRSAYDAIANRQISIEIEGKPKKVTPKEALELKTFQDALNGKIFAIRLVLGWIDEREAARRPGGITPPPLAIRYENQNPISIDNALSLLDIAVSIDDDDGPYLKLEPWAVQQAVDRLRHRLDASDIADIVEHVKDPEVIEWAKGFGDG